MHQTSPLRIGKLPRLIVDDDGWEPDEDFYVELYSKESGDRLNGDDTITRVTILDDDKPGMLVFEEKKAVQEQLKEERNVQENLIF